MRKACYVSLTVAVALLLLAAIVFLSSRFGPRALDSGKRFIAGLQNSLYYLDRAKHQWANEKQKSEPDIPTLSDLTPYLGDWRDAIERLKELGIDYAVTSIAEPQSDVATLTRDLHFRSGICHFYSAGTSYGLLRGWSHPQLSTASSFRALYFNNQYLLVAALCILALVNLLVFVVKRMRYRKEVPIRARD